MLQRPFDKDKNEYYNYASDIVSLQNYIKGMAPVGDGDIPEDWIGVYIIAMNNMNWRNGNKLIIHKRKMQ